MNYENQRAPVAVILAAGIGARMGSLTMNNAKCLLGVGGSVILERMIRNCLSCGVSQFVVVLGHKADEVRKFVDKTFRGIRVTYVVNDRYRDTNTGYSLMLAASAVGTSEFIKFDADLVFDTKILRNLLDNNLPNTLCIDRDFAAAGGVKVLTDDQMRVTEIGEIDAQETHVTPIGIEKISAITGPLLFAELKKLMEDKVHAQDTYETAYQRLISNAVPFHALDITGMKWTGIDTAEDFAAANAMFGSPVTTVSRGQQRALDEAADAPPRTPRPVI
jgi:choline kinase